MLQEWVTKSDQVLTQLKHAEHHLRSVRSKFHGALPHGFIQPDIPTEMEVSLQTVTQTLESTTAEAEKAVARIKGLQTFFA
ncbi:putative regulator protein [Vibrio maritimus]|uniref:Putative regulator protein n=2 Tax=Vibrio maritimus TaxID=990268 RepID=A0A090RQ40_9VIBR|nr:putative regulator protein [Vibrio maritimus]